MPDPNGVGHYEHHLPLATRVAHFVVCLVVAGVCVAAAPQVLEPYGVADSPLWGPDAAYHSGRDGK